MTAAMLERIRTEVVLSSESWRRRLLSPDALAKLAKDLGLGWFTASDIAGLWEIGLLRADLVSSDVPLDHSGLRRLDGICEAREHAYCDFRDIEHRSEGYGSALEADENGTLEHSLAFHPFRVYVLHHIERTLAISTTNIVSTLSASTPHRCRMRLPTLRR